MKFSQIACLFLKVLIVSVFAASASLSAQAPASPKTNIATLFSQSSILLTSADDVCDVESCHDAVRQATLVINEGRALDRQGSLTGQTKRQWHARYGASLLALRAEVEKVEARKVQEEPVRYLEDFGPAPRLQRSAYTCDQVFNIGIGLAALYALASPPAGIILGLVTIYGYNNCIAANG